MEFYLVAYSYLKGCGIKINREYLRIRMQSHPEYPYLVSLADTLDELRIPFAAVQAEKELYKDLHFPFLAHIGQGRTAIFKQMNSLLSFEKDQRLLNEWDGVGFYIDQPEYKIVNKEHDSFVQKKRQLVSLQLSFFFLLLALYVTAVAMAHNMLFFIVLLLSLCGITVCLLIVQYNLGISNTVTEGLCGSEVNNSCGKVLNSPPGKIFKHTGLADIGLFYFLVQQFFLLLSSITKNEGGFLLLAILSIAALLFTFYSLWYQWRIRAWCTLCLIITGIVWLQAFSLVEGARALYFSFSSFLLLVFSSLFAFSWFIVKHYMVQTEDAVKKTVESFQWKRNPSLFVSLLKMQRQVAPPGPHCPAAGNSGASVHITVVSNPYCKPCSIAHEQLDELARIYPEDVQVKICFFVPADNAEDRRTIAAARILEAYLATPMTQKSEVTAKWFAWMDLEKWDRHFAHTENNSHITGYLLEDQEWCTKNGITHTPAIFINGYELPRNYTAGDLKLIIPSVTEFIPKPAETMQDDNTRLASRGK